jgi:hypothetical protein
MNIYNQNVAFNYRGILNLDATTINTPLDATLRAVTDGMGTSSLLNLSTEQVGVLRTVNLAAGATTPRLFNVAYTINNSGAQTGTLTGLFLNATETALNGINHNLMDLQVGGVSKFKVDNNGTVTSASNFNAATYFQWSGSSRIKNESDGIISLYNNAINGFTRLNLGGTTSSFPGIKRNGANLQARLADDSNFCNFDAAAINGSYIISANGMASQSWYDKNLSSVWLTVTDTTGAATFKTTALFAPTGTINASARVQIDSTTQGFLPPRMTTAQINAIATPAEGLQVYNTTISHMCFYMGGAWQKINHSPM